MNLVIDKKSNFSAKEPSLGYLYQIRYGLYLLLTSRQENNTKILIESLDDIEIIHDNFIDLYQTKFHLKTDRNLTDRSSDFWKTIRVWCEQIIDNSIDIENTIFTLITTESLSKNSIILDIKNKKNVTKIVTKLNNISLEKNKINIKGYSAFNKLSQTEKEFLVTRIRIIDSSMDFSSLDRKIIAELRISVLPNHVDALYERIEGWFLQSTINHLLGKKKNIEFIELNRKIVSIIDQFKNDNLPSDFPEKIIDKTGIKLDKYKAMLFVKQLDLIRASKRIKQNAISDYYRAYSQRSKWINDELLDPQEEVDYEKRLIDDWIRKFDLLLDDTEEQTEKKVNDFSLSFYKENYIKKVPKVFIRERFREAYLVLGSSHMLSQDLKIGWHPEYTKNLEGDFD